jgi:hypothetical protein
MRKPALEDLRRQVSPPLPAQNALRYDGLGRHGLDWRGNALAAPLAPDHDALLAIGNRKHKLSIGEQKANKSTALIVVHNQQSPG